MYKEEIFNKYLSNLGLKYKWERPDNGSKYIIVENEIKYIPFSFWTIDLKSMKSYHNKNKFYELCEKLSENKK